MQKDAQDQSEEARNVEHSIYDEAARLHGRGVAHPVTYYPHEVILKAVLDFNAQHQRPVARCEFPSGVTREVLRRLVKTGALIVTDVMDTEPPYKIQKGYWHSSFYKGIQLGTDKTAS